MSDDTYKADRHKQVTEFECDHTTIDCDCFGQVTYCVNDPCETEATTKRGGSPYCFTCAQAYDAGYEAGLLHDVLVTKGGRY